jgi:hypothetical protein
MRLSATALIKGVGKRFASAEKARQRYDWRAFSLVCGGHLTISLSRQI